MNETPRASATQFTSFGGEGAEAVAAMQGRVGVPDPSKFTVWTEELSKDDQERLKKTDSQRPAASFTLAGRFKCQNHARCGFTAVEPNRVFQHQPGCDLELKRGDEWAKNHPDLAAKGMKAPPQEPEAPVVLKPALTEERVAEIIDAKFGGFLAEIKGLLKPSQPAKDEGTPNESAEAHRAGDEAGRPEPLAPVEFTELPVGDPPQGPGSADEAA